MLTSELYCQQEIWDMDNAIVLEFVNVYSISSVSTIYSCGLELYLNFSDQHFLSNVFTVLLNVDCNFCY